MDIYCPKCSEPWEIDTLHDVADEQGSSFGEVREDFYRRGCAAIGTRCNPATVGDASPAIAAAYDLLGDDVDGAASMLEDAEHLGLL